MLAGMPNVGVGGGDGWSRSEGSELCECARDQRRIVFVSEAPWRPLH